MRKIAINLPLRFFSAIIEIVRELLISSMHNKFELSCPQINGNTNADDAEFQLQ